MTTQTRVTTFPLMPSLALTCLLGASLLAGCSGGSGGTTPDPDEVDAADMLAHYAQSIVLQTYANLDAEAGELESAVDALLATPDTTTLAAAQDAWKATRAPWENSESCLFGPVTNLGLDPALDSWPVNRTDLDNVLASATVLTEASIMALDDPLRGFHTVEYLLFDDGNGSRVAADIVATLTTDTRRRDYLNAASEDLATNAGRLHDAWRAADGNFVNEFLTAGTGSVVYPSQRAAVQELIVGMMTICDEVANGKINDPVSQADGTLEESQFSDNSLKDFADNIRGVRNVYFGSLDGSTDPDSFSALMADLDPGLDTEVRTKITAAIDAIEDIPAPFRTSIFDAGAADEIADAQDAINAVFDVLEAEVTPLIEDTDFTN